MKTALAGFAAILILAASTDFAAAQIAPRWTHSGSAVCPEGHDFRGGACWSRGGYGYRGDRGYRRSYGYQDSYGGGSRAVQPRWNRAGSAVCPEDFDFVRGVCRSRY
jgi:hypothetical protein